MGVEVAEVGPAERQAVDYRSVSVWDRDAIIMMFIRTEEDGVVGRLKGARVCVGQHGTIVIDL
jgi:hypothetical protein